MSNVKFIKDTLYVLKRNHNIPLKIVDILRVDQNLSNGTQQVYKRVMSVKRAIRLPNNVLRKFVQDIAYLAANKNFTYGALNDFQSEFLIIDRRDLPKHFKPNLNQHVIMQDRRYDLVDFTEVETDVAYIYRIREIRTDQPSDGTGGIVPLPPPPNVLEEVKSFDFFFGDAPRAVYTMPRPGVVILTSLTIRQAFNGTNPVIQVGHNSVPDSLMQVQDSDVTEAYEYQVSTDLQLQTNDTVTLTITPNGATQGSGILTFIVSYDD